MSTFCTWICWIFVAEWISGRLCQDTSVCQTILLVMKAEPKIKVVDRTLSVSIRQSQPETSVTRDQDWTMWKCLVIGIHFGLCLFVNLRDREIILWQEVFKALLFFLFDRKCFLFWILWKVSFRLTESHTTVKCLKLEYYTLMWSLQERRKLMVSLSHHWRKSPKNCYFSFFCLHLITRLHHFEQKSGFIFLLQLSFPRCLTPLTLK